MNERESERDEEKISRFLPYDPNQELLLPKSVQEYIPENHIARTVGHIIVEQAVGTIHIS